MAITSMKARSRIYWRNQDNERRAYADFRSLPTSAYLVVGTARMLDDSVAPLRLSGQYAFAGWVVSPTWTPSTLTQYLWPSALALTVDSVHDTLVVHSDGTYQEEGGVWGYDFGGPYSAPLDVHGTYGVHSSGFTLIPNNGSLVNSSTAAVYGDTLTIVRYPGTWKLARF